MSPSMATTYEPELQSIMTEKDHEQGMYLIYRINAQYVTNAQGEFFSKINKRTGLNKRTGY